DEQHALKVTLSAKSGEHTLLIGKPADDGTPGRYAKLAKDPAVFVVNEDLVKAVDHTALDMLDPVLVRLDPGRLERVEWRAGGVNPPGRRAGGVNPPVGSHLKLERKGDEWRVLDAPG